MWHYFCNTGQLFLLHSSTSFDEAFLPAVSPPRLSTTPGRLVLRECFQDKWSSAHISQPLHSGQAFDDRGSVNTEDGFAFLSGCPSSPHKRAGWVRKAGEISPEIQLPFRPFKCTRLFLAWHVHPWVERSPPWEERNVEQKNCKRLGRIRTKGIFGWRGCEFPTLTSE